MTYALFSTPWSDAQSLLETHSFIARLARSSIRSTWLFVLEDAAPSTAVEYAKFVKASVKSTNRLTTKLGASGLGSNESFMSISDCTCTSQTALKRGQAFKFTPSKYPSSAGMRRVDMTRRCVSLMHIRMSNPMASRAARDMHVDEKSLNVANAGENTDSKTSRSPRQNCSQKVYSNVAVSMSRRFAERNSSSMLCADCVTLSDLTCTTSGGSVSAARTVSNRLPNANAPSTSSRVQFVVPAEAFEDANANIPVRAPTPVAAAPSACVSFDKTVGEAKSTAGTPRPASLSSCSKYEATEALIDLETTPTYNALISQ